MSELREILKKIDTLKTNVFPEGNPFHHGGISLDEAEQAILAWHEAELERVIGEEETDEDEIINDLYCATRNGLRVEQRKRAGL